MTTKNISAGRAAGGKSTAAPATKSSKAAARGKAASPVAASAPAAPKPKSKPAIKPSIVKPGIKPKVAKPSAPEPMPNPFRTGMRRSRAPEPATLVIFGVTGDLSRRKLLSAVFGLWQDGLLGSAFNIVGVGRQAMTDEQFRDYALEALRTSKETDAVQPGSLEKFRELLYYEHGDFAGDEV